MSLEINTPITLDFYVDEYKTVNAKQYSINSTFVTVTCTDKGQFCPLDSLTMTAVINYYKPDGKFVENTCEILSDGTIKVELTQQMLIVAGTAKADITIASSSEGSVLPTMCFYVQIHESAVPDNAVASSSEATYLNTLMIEAQQALTDNYINDNTPSLLSAYSGTKVDSLITPLSTQYTDPTTTTAETTAQIVSLSNTVDGQVTGLYEGNTYQNLVSNGNFASVTGWTNSNATISVSENVATILAIATQGQVYQSIKTVVGHKYFVRGQLKSTSTSVALRFKEVSSYVTSVGIYNTISMIQTAVATTTVLVIHDTRTSAWDNIYAKELQVVDLTQMLMDTLSVTQCHLAFPNWFDNSLNSILSGNVKSVGLNKFNINDSTATNTNAVSNINDQSISISTVTASTTSTYKKFSLILKPNTTYRIKCSSTRTGTTGGGIAIYNVDLVKVISWNGDTLNPNFTFTTLADGRTSILLVAKSGVTTADSATFTNIMLTEGTAEYTYESYRNNQITVSLPSAMDGLKRLQNGAYDYFNLSGGVTQRVSNIHTTLSTEISLNTSSYTNVDIVSIPLANLSGIIIPTTTEYLGTSVATTISSPLNGGTVDLASNVWKHYKGAASLAIIVPKGQYATSAAAQTALAGTKVIYELTQSITYDIDLLPVLAFKNGSVSFDSTIVPTLNYTVPTNVRGQVDSNTGMIGLLTESNVDLIANKLDKTGDASNTTVAFTEATTLANIASGENKAVLFGKITKFFSFIGTTTLTTTATTITTAINELVTKITNTVPIGSIQAYIGSTAPTNYLICNGAAISRTTYATLYSLVGTTYGLGDGSTTFNLPNYKGRMLVGLDSSDTSFDVLGESGGEKTHILSTGEIPSHAHTVNGLTGVDDSNFSGSGGAFAAADTGLGSEYDQPTTSSGSGLAHENMPPYRVINYIIKVL